MNVLFLTLGEIKSVNDRGIYQDLLRKFSEEGHDVTIVTPVERRKKIATNLKKEKNVSILQVRTFNIQKTNIVEKGIGTLAIEYQYLKAIKKYLTQTKFDLVLYSTPPITFGKVISFIKKRDKAYSYLLLKDIFPQNAVDMKMLKENNFLHKMFVKKEKKLYEMSDFIGCMSQANVDFVLNHNPEVNEAKIEVNPNSIEPKEINYTELEKNQIREKYNIPLDKKILIYGGNLGRPQGLDFLLETIADNKNKNVFFLVVGSGTEFERINNWFQTKKPNNALLLKNLPKQDYDVLLASCDIGLIFLHKDFLIPNFPSRLLSYLEMRKPVLAATDRSSDIGDVIEQANCGKKSNAGDLEQIGSIIDYLVDEADLKEMGENGWKLLQNEYRVEKSYDLIYSKLNPTKNLAS